MLDRKGFTEKGYSFQVELLSLVEDFCQYLEEKGFEFRSEIQTALTSYFALIEVREALDEIISHFERLPVFQDRQPKEIFDEWIVKKDQSKLVKFKKRGEEGGNKKIY